LPIFDQMKFQVIPIIGVIVIVAASPGFCQEIAFSQTQEMHFHSQKVGLSGMNAIMINWSDRNDYEISSNVREMPSTEEGIGIEADVIAKRGNDTSGDFTLGFVVGWMPKARKFWTPPLYPKEIVAGSNLTIQSKIATVVKLREGTAENDALQRMLPSAIDSQSAQQNLTAEAVYAVYHPDYHTTVTVIAPAGKWTDSDFKEMLESIEITMPSSSFASSYSYEPAPSWEKWCCRRPTLWDYRCSGLSCL
jgi:hypothetical protein